MASKAQKRSVSDAEVERYEKYDSQFGAKYMDEPHGTDGCAPGAYAAEGGDCDPAEEDW
jgi:hypothetical protein